jgi:hypothetical protein
VGAATSDTRHDGVRAGAALRGAGRGRASVLPGGMWFSTPATGRVVGAA